MPVIIHQIVLALFVSKKSKKNRFFCKTCVVHSSNALSSFKREGIIIPLYRHFVIYPGGTSVDEGAGVEEVSLIYPRTLVYIGTRCRSRAARSG